MSTYDSKLGDKFARKRRQQELNAEHILEDIMRRQNWTPETRDDLASALLSVGNGQDLRSGGSYGGQMGNAAHILERVLHRRAWSLDLQERLAQALVHVAAGEPLRISNNSKKGFATTMQWEISK